MFRQGILYEPPCVDDRGCYRAQTIYRSRNPNRNGAFETTGDGKSKYCLGFHIFPNKWDAVRFKKAWYPTAGAIVEVRYQGIYAKGRQHIRAFQKSAPCVVARWMKIVGDG